MYSHPIATMHIPEGKEAKFRLLMLGCGVDEIMHYDYVNTAT
jgi:hypothetical protein